MSGYTQYCHRHVFPRAMVHTGITRHHRTGQMIWNWFCPSCGRRRGIVEDFRTKLARVLFEK